MVQRGGLEASLESTILLSTTDPRWMVFSYLWLFPNHAMANAVCDGPLGQEMHAQENPLSVIHSTKLYEVQDHLTLWDYVYDPIVLCVNRRFWEGLPEGDRAVLRQCAREAMDYERRLVEEVDTVFAGKLAEKGMKVVWLTDTERERFRQAAAALGGLLIPALSDNGYGRGFASALLASSGGLGIIAPPSIAMVIYGLVASDYVKGGFCTFSWWWCTRCSSSWCFTATSGSATSSVSCARARSSRPRY